jgi:hypothetical protein
MSVVLLDSLFPTPVSAFQFGILVSISIRLRADKLHNLPGVIEYNYMATNYKYKCVVAAKNVQVLNIVEADILSYN